MKRMKHGVRALLFIIALFASLLTVSSGTANATSVYDNMVRQGGFLVDNGNCAGDATSSWISTINNPSSWVDSANQSAIAGHFSTALSNETGWAVIQREAKANHDAGSASFVTGDRYLTVLISANSSTELNFTTTVDYGKVLLPTTSVDALHIAWTGGGSQPCELKVIGSGVSVSPWYSPFAMEDNNSYVFNSLVRYDQVFVNFTINYPTGYEGTLIPTEPPPAKSVFMGDSFSSGEGNAPFEYGTDEDEVNECHRSTSAYPNWLSQTPSLNLGSTAFVACSGATTANVLHGGTSDGAWNESPQVDALSDDTEVVTITIGGNDIGFSAFATACAAPSSECDSSTTIYSTTMYKIHNVLPGSLEGVLTEIADRTSHAKVYVIGYPYVTPSSGLDSLPVQCSYLSSSAGDGADSLAARNVVTELNSEIGDAVAGFTNTLSDTEFEYIDPNASIDGSFDGHDLCQGLDSYFHNVAPNDVFGNGYRQKIFHPNVDGQYEYYQIVSGVMEQS